MENTNSGIQTNANVLSGVIDVYATNAYVENLYLGNPPVDLTTTIAGLDADITILEGQMVTANSNIATLQGQMTTANSNISTLQGQMTTANSNISTLQGQVSTLDGEVNTLQSEMNTAQSDINTLQSEMNTAQSDINTLQSEMNTAQSDIIALYSTTAASTAAIAGLAVSQAAQDVTIAAQGVSIGILQGDVFALDNRIDTLETKTADQSWGSLTGTSFSTKVNVGGGGGVVLNTGSASEFNSGITTDLVRSFDNNDLVLEGRGTGDAILKTNGTNRIRCYDNGQIDIAGSSGNPMNITTTGTMTLSSATNTDINIGNNQTSGVINIGVNTSANRTGSINLGNGGGAGAPATALNWGTGSNTGQLSFRGGSFNLLSTGIFTASSGSGFDANLFTAQAGGVINLGTLSNRSGGININTGATSTAAVRIGSNTTNNAPITIGSSASAGQVVDIFGANLNIGGVGTTNLAVQSAPASNILFGTNKTGGGIYFGMYDPTASTNALYFNIGSLNTGSINFGTGASAKTITFGSAAATNNLIGTTTITGTTNINTTGTANTSIGNNTGNTTVNAGVLNLNASAGITIDGGVSTITMTSDEDLTISTATALGDIFILSDANSTFTSVAQTTINSVAFDLNATGAITIDTTDNMTLQADGITINALVAGNQLQATLSTLIQSGTTTTLTSTGETEINCAALDINATGAITIDSTSTIGITGTTNTVLGITNVNTTGTAATSIGNATGAVALTGSLNTVLGTTYINETGVSNTRIGNTTGTLQLKGSGISLVGSTIINDTGTEATSIGNTSATLQLKGSTNTITGVTNINHLNTLATTIGNTTGVLTLRGTTNVNTTGTAATNIGNTTGALDLDGSTITTTSTGTTQINSVALDINASGALTIDPLTFTMNATALTGTAMTWQSNTVGSDLILSNPTAGAFSIESGAGQNLQFKTTSLGDLNFDSDGDMLFNAVSILDTTAGTGVNFTATTGNINFTATTGDINLTSSAGTTTLNGATEIDLQIGGNSKIEIVDATVTVNPTTTIKNQIGGVDKLTITSTNVTANPTTQFLAEIGGVDKLTITSTTTTHDNNSTFNGNVLILQTATPPTSTSALGYTNFQSTLTDPMTTAFISRSNFNIPSKGTWLVVCGYEWVTNAANTVESKRITLSPTSGSTTAAGYGLQYFEEINDAAGAASARQYGTIMGVVQCSGALTIHVNASSSVASGTNTELRTNVSWTRIG